VKQGGQIRPGFVTLSLCHFIKPAAVPPKLFSAHSARFVASELRFYATSAPEKTQASQNMNFARLV
jgi:hypothetical protein